MRTDGMICGGTSLNDGREKFDASSIMIGIVAIAIIVIAAGLYFGISYFNLGQYWWPYLRWLKFIIPIGFLAFCWFVFYSGGVEEAEDEEN